MPLDRLIAHQDPDVCGAHDIGACKLLDELAAREVAVELIDSLEVPAREFPAVVRTLVAWRARIGGGARWPATQLSLPAELSEVVLARSLCAAMRGPPSWVRRRAPLRRDCPCS